jgi:hypothetical protein
VEAVSARAMVVGKAAWVLDALQSGLPTKYLYSLVFVSVSVE